MPSPRSCAACWPRPAFSFGVSGRAPVETRRSPRTRSGCARTISIDTHPPKLKPPSKNRGMPRSSARARTSSAIASTVDGPSPSGDSPWPRRSGRTTRKPADTRSPTCPSQTWRSVGEPWRRKNGVPPRGPSSECARRAGAKGACPLLVEVAPDGNQVNEKQHEGDLAPESGAPEAEKELEDENQDREPPRPRAHSPQPEPRDEHEGSPHHDGRAEGRAHEDATSTREQAADEAQADGKDDPGD